MKRAGLATFVISVLVAGAAMAVDGAPWPTTAWTATPPDPSVDGPELQASIDAFFVDPEPAIGATRALLVVHQGRIVAERYGDGHDRDTRHVSWSMAKSVTHALVGAAVHDGRVDIDEPVGDPHWAPDDPRAAITWRHLLTMTSGLDWLEMEATTVTESDAALILFGPGRGDVAEYAAEKASIDPPGQAWKYSTGSTHLAAAALTRTIAGADAEPDSRRETMRAFMGEHLFEPIGMRSALFEFDPVGTFYGGSLLYATARDYARFGLLYLRDGLWDGARILPDGWVDFARTPALDDVDVYGAGFWLEGEGRERPFASYMQAAPSDAYAAEGFQGQMIVIVPSKDLVVVRLGLMTDGRDSWRRLGAHMQRVVLAFPDR